MPKSSDDANKNRAVDLAISQIEKQFGRGSIMRLGDDSMKVEAAVIPTGSLALDGALGIGGMPRGRVVELFGPESSGKTTLAQSVVAQAQKLGGYAAYIDSEHALDSGYAKSMGVDIDNLLISQPDCGEDALEIADTLIRSGAIDIIVIDSVAALVPRAELEGEMGDAHVGLQARLMSQALRKLTGHISRSKTCVIFINQIRMKIGVMFGNPETTTGGNALKFYSSVRVDIRRVATLKDRDNAIGMRAKVKVVKNKLASPFKTAEFDIMFDGTGISTEGDAIDLGTELNIIEKSGTWFSYGTERLGQGRENVRNFLREHTDIRDTLVAQIREKLGLKALPEIKKDKIDK
ncbi:MAG: recombinase RecA [Candidatus Latescibacteria bacterium]|nr:recombinase RecA [Candidatus Latescibacterota bacterium]